MAKNFVDFNPRPTKGPYGFSRVVPVTPSNTTDLPEFPAALWIGGAGNVVVDIGGATSVALNSVPTGLFPIRPIRVRATGTTATNILAMYD